VRIWCSIGLNSDSVTYPDTAPQLVGNGNAGHLIVIAGQEGLAAPSPPISGGNLNVAGGAVSEVSAVENPPGGGDGFNSVSKSTFTPEGVFDLYFADSPTYAKERRIGYVDIGFGGYEPGFIFEIQLLAISPTYTEELESGANASSEVKRVTKQAWVEGANATSVASGRDVMKLAASANATATDASKGKHTLSLADTAGAADAAIPITVAKVVDSAASTSTLVTRRPMTLESSANATSVQAAKIVHTEVSTGDSAANTTAGRNITQTESATADATSTVVGLRKVTATEVSSGVAVNADTSHRTTVQELVSSGDITATLVQRAKIHATEVSGAIAADTVRFAAGPFAIPVYWTNSRSMAAAQWSGQGFNSFVEKDGAVYAAHAEGIKLLSAQADDGTTPISALVGWDLQPWGSGKKKRLQSVYIPGLALGPFRFRVVCEQGGYDYQTHLASALIPTKHRAPLGRGLNSVYYRWGLLQDYYFSIADPITIHSGDTTREI
jgi:hypothetical protein